MYNHPLILLFRKFWKKKWVHTQSLLQLWCSGFFLVELNKASKSGSWPCYLSTAGLPFIFENTCSWSWSHWLTRAWLFRGDSQISSTILEGLKLMTFLGMLNNNQHHTGNTCRMHVCLQSLPGLSNRPMRWHKSSLVCLMWLQKQLFMHSWMVSFPQEEQCFI